MKKKLQKHHYKSYFDVDSMRMQKVSTPFKMEEVTDMINTALIKKPLKQVVPAKKHSSLKKSKSDSRLLRSNTVQFA